MYFPGIPKIQFEGVKSNNPFAFRFYDKDKVVAGKPMRAHLRFAMSYWHTLCSESTDMFGAGTRCMNFGGTTPLEISQNRVAAAFELMEKLGIEYFCFHDRDIAPEGATLRESNENIDRIVPLLKQEMERTDRSTKSKAIIWRAVTAMRGCILMKCPTTFPQSTIISARRKAGFC